MSHTTVAAAPLAAPSRFGALDNNDHELAASLGPQAARSKRIERQSAAGTSAQQLFGSTLPPAHNTSSNAAATAPFRFTEHRAAAPHSGDTSTAAHTQALERLVCPPSASCHVQLAQLQDEKAYLTTYVERILTQLRTVLRKHGELEKLTTLVDPELLAEQSERSTTDVDAAASAHAAPWLTSQEFTNPLFQAYDLKIYELERSVAENKKAVDRIVTRAEALAKENTMLRQEMEVDAEKLLLRAQHDAPSSSTGVHLTNTNAVDVFNAVDSSEYISEINERIDVLMAENSMLMEQVSLQDDELRSIRSDVTDRDAQLEAMHQHFTHATSALTELRDAHDATRAEKRRCEQQLQQFAARIAQLESQREGLASQTDTLRRERETLDDQLLEYETLLSAVKTNAARKDAMHTTQYTNVCARLRELNAVVTSKQQTLEDVENQRSALQVDLEAARHDCEGMLHVLTGMEKQLTTFSQREDAVAELESDCKAKVEEVILEKEQLVAHETQSRREIARLLERLKQQTSEHLRAMDDVVGTNKRKHDTELHTRDDEVRTLSDALAQLRIQCEFATRSQREAEKKLLDATRRFQETTDVFDKKLRQFGERAAAAEEARDQSSHLEGEYLQKLRNKEDELTKLRTEYRERTQELTDKLGALSREVELRRSEARDRKDESDEKTQRIALLNDELQKVKTDCASRFTIELEAIHKQNRELRAQNADAAFQLAQHHQATSAAASAASNDRERAEVRLLAEIESLKARVAALKDERQRVETLRQTAEAQNAVSALQLQQLRRDVIDAHEQLDERERACDDADRKVTELSAQLTLALTKQQQFYRQERELRTAVERLTLERTRMEREVQLCRKKVDEYRSSSGAPTTLYSSGGRSMLIDAADRRAAAAELHAARHLLYDDLLPPTAATTTIDKPSASSVVPS